jgi:hypothetical protein
MVMANRNPPCIEALASEATTQINAMVLRTAATTVRRPGAVFKYPISIMIKQARRMRRE